MSDENKSLLKVNNLSVSFDTNEGSFDAVKSVNFDLKKGETLAIIGESGSGKSVTASVIMGILTCPPGRIKSGEVLLNDLDILKLSDSDRRKLMGSKVAIIFQDTLSHLNPVFSVGSQIAECFEVHKNLSKKDSWKKAVKLLERVRIPNPSRRAKDFPHQFSGGQRQRVMIAMALALEPDIIIADEPTTALDVTIQAKILELLGELRDERNMGLILITHDLAIAAEISDKVIVLNEGKIVEKGITRDVFINPNHAYTRQLMDSIPGKITKKSRSSSITQSLTNAAFVGYEGAFLYFITTTLLKGNFAIGIWGAMVAWLIFASVRQSIPSGLVSVMCIGTFIVPIFLDINLVMVIISAGLAAAACIAVFSLFTLIYRILQKIF